jgi:hypothetical protein
MFLMYNTYSLINKKGLTMDSLMAAYNIKEFNNTTNFFEAISKGSLISVKQLINSDFTHDMNLPKDKNKEQHVFLLAAISSNPSVLKFLLDSKKFTYSDPDFKIIEMILRNKKTSILKVLIEYKLYDFSIDNNSFLLYTYSRGFLNLSQILFEDDNVKKTLKKDDIALFRILNEPLVNEKINQF